jgi:hypothetical protein
MARRDAQEEKPSREEASRRKWLKRLRSTVVVISGVVISGAVLLLRGRKSPH